MDKVTFPLRGSPFHDLILVMSEAFPLHFEGVALRESSDRNDGVVLLMNNS